MVEEVKRRRLEHDHEYQERIKKRMEEDEVFAEEMNRKKKERNRRGYQKKKEKWKELVARAETDSEAAKEIEKIRQRNRGRHQKRKPRVRTPEQREKENAQQKIRYKIQRQKMKEGDQELIDKYDLLCVFSQEMLGSQIEQVAAVFLDMQGRAISYSILSQGGVSRTTLATTHFLQTALLADSYKIVLSHYHPNGDPTPSEQDWDLTEDLAQACTVCGLDLVDHVVLSCSPTDPGKPLYASMREMDTAHRIWKTPLPENFYMKPSDRAEEVPKSSDLDVYGNQ